MKWQLLKRSATISLVVGTSLNVINQGHDVLNGAAVQWWHFLLNYLVPFLVASYSAWANDKAQGQDNNPGARSG